MTGGECPSSGLATTFLKSAKKNVSPANFTTNPNIRNPFVPETSPLLEVSQLCKSFPGVRALYNVSLRLHSGEVLAVLGENGAGKSTLMKILAGVQPADSGTIKLEGRKVAFENTRAAIQSGVVLIHQELNLCGNLNVGENIFLGREPNSNGFVRRREIYQRSEEYLQRVGLNVSPKTIVGDLTIGRQQMVEIAKALSVDAKILIMDEPTSSLSGAESARLFQLIETLRGEGVSIIYISHRLGEVIRLADRVVVLRDGENAGDLGKEEITHDNMVQRMVGREISKRFGRQYHEIGSPVLEVESLVTPAWPHELSFNVCAGEIVGVSGLVGAGRTELLQVLFGIDRAVSGQIKINGKSVTLNSPQAAIDHGLALVPEDRKRHGLVIDFSVAGNIGLPSLKNNASSGIADFSAQRRDTKKMIEAMAIRTPSENQTAKFLSGGNQQKVVIGKWLAMQPKLILLDEPTRGIDVGAKQEIYQLMEELAAKQMAVLFVSSEMEEILSMADRTIVMHEGKITGELSRDEMSEESIMQLATGNTSLHQTSNGTKE